MPPYFLRTLDQTSKLVASHIIGIILLELIASCRGEFGGLDLSV